MSEYIQSETIAEAVKQIEDALQSIINELTVPLIKKCAEIKENFFRMFGGFNYYCIHYENRRVVHLALYARKQRIRKKNLNRLLNDYHKSLQGGVKSYDLSLCCEQKSGNTDPDAV